MVVVLILATLVFILARAPATAFAVPRSDFDRRGNFWIAITLVAFLSSKAMAAVIDDDVGWADLADDSAQELGVRLAAPIRLDAVLVVPVLIVQIDSDDSRSREIGFPHSQRRPTALWVRVSADADLEQGERSVPPRPEMRLVVLGIVMSESLIAPEEAGEFGQIAAAARGDAQCVLYRSQCPFALG